MNEDGQYTVVWKSSKIDNSLNPVWGTVKISMNSLCNGDIHRPLKIEIFDWDSNGKHDTMGHVSAAVWALCVYGELFEYHCRNLLYMYTFFIYIIIDKCVSISALIFFASIIVEQVETSVQAMISNPEAQMDVIEPAKVKTKKTYTNSGHLVAGGAHIEHHPTFTQASSLYCILFYSILFSFILFSFI